jgi:hypothetical protein
MFCPECGFGADEARFCPDCGTSLDQFRAAVGDEEIEDDAFFEAQDEDEEYPDDEVVRAPRPTPRATGSRGRAPARKPSRQARAQQSRAARSRTSRAAIPAARPSRLSPAVIWMSFATVAVIVIIGVFVLTRTPSGASGSVSGAAAPTGPIAADISGSYSQLVQRANGLYDQGAQAFQKKDQGGGAQYFAAAAKVYRAAWKQQSTDPNVGTDYATSLFYSGDTAAALKQVRAVITKSPGFQTAHLNEGIYLETASQDAQQGGQKAKADSLLAQAKAEFQKAVSIDPGSSAGAKAAEDLKSL